jgi:type IV pilus assembly protein PilV
MFVLKRDESGLTLIETLISLMIFSVGMLGISKLTTVIIYGNILSQQITMATIVAQDKVEALHNISYDALKSQTERILAESQRHYTCKIDVSNNTPQSGMKTVSVTVSWRRNNTDRHVSLKTIRVADGR